MRSRPPRGRTAATRAKALDVAARFALLGVLVAVMTTFSIVTPDTYLSSQNFLSIGEQQAITLLLALAVLLPLTVGEFDLSVAATFGLAQLMVAGLMSRNDLPVVVAIALIVAMGAAVGLVNGFLIVKLEISSFIATLGMSTVLAGVGLAYAGGEVISTNVPQSFLDIAQHEVLGVQLPIVYALVASLALWFVLALTATGRRLVATGGNRGAARLTGIRTERLIVLSFVGCGALAAIAGVIIASNLGSGQPTLGPTYLLPAYAGAFLGATTIRPGRFNVGGTLIAVYLLAATVTGLQQLGAADWVESLFNGGALIVAVAFSGYVARLRRRRPRHPAPAVAGEAERELVA
jgi:ribose transport system permease protein